MRAFSLLFLILVLFLSLVLWKKTNDASWELCAELSSEYPENIQVKGNWFITKGGMRSLDPLVCAFGVCQKLALTVFISQEFLNEKAARTVIGNFRCVLKSQNPSRSFMMRFFERPALFSSRYRIVEYEKSLNFIDRFSLRYQKRFPYMDALVQSVWKGTTAGFEEEFIQFYRRGGLSHILAVSGTHVMVLFYLLNKASAFLFFFFPGFLQRKNLWFYRSALVLAASFLLWNYSPGNAPVYRTCFFFITLSCLNLKLWRSCSVQIVCSGLALLLLFEPNLIVSESFWLSSIGALFLSFRLREKFLRTYFLGVVLLPFLLAPLVSMLFGHLSLATPLLSVFFSPLWDIVLIPLGYVCPLVLVLGKQGERVLGFSEKFIDLIAEYQNLLFPWVEKSQLVIARLNLLEAACLTVCLVLLVVAASRFQERIS